MLLGLLVILVLAACLRLYGLGNASLWYDEGASLYLSHYLATPAALFDSTKTVEPPLNAVLTGLWAGAIGMVSASTPTDQAHDFLLRLLPCLFGILNCLLLYILTRRIYHCTRTACCAAFLFAIAPFQIYYAQELRIYSFYVTLALLAVWATIQALDGNKRRHWALYILTLTVLMYSHYFTMWLIFSLNLIYVALLGKYRHRFWPWTIANAVLMVLLAPALYGAFTMHAEVQGLEVPWYPNPTWKTGLITFKTFFAGYGPRAWAYGPLFLLTIALWFWGVLRPRKYDLATVVVAGLTWIPILGCLWLWGGADFSFYEHRLFLFSGVLAIVGVARGIILLGRPGMVGLALISLLTLPCLADFYQGRLHPIPMHRLAMWDKVDFRDAARLMEDQWKPGDRLVYTSHFSAYSMFHYLPHDQLRIGWGPEDEVDFIKTLGHEAILREHKLMPVPKERAIDGATRIWFLSTQGITFEWQPTTTRIREWLDSVATAQERHSFPGVELICYVPN